MKQSVPDFRVYTLLPNPDMCDAYSLRVKGRLAPLEAASRMFHATPPWVSMLMKIRNALVKPFGLKVSASDLPSGVKRFGMFPLIRQERDAVVLGLNDKHLDFRLVVEVKNEASGTSLVTLGTNVKCHNWFGRTYLALIRPFHRRIAPAMLAQLAD